jgi:hypothetical protein
MFMTRMKLASRQDYLSLVILVVLVGCFANEMVWAGKIPFFRDLGTYFYPMRFSLAESLKMGELPLWDRHVAMGFPLLADFQSAAFYPLHLLYLVLPFFAAVRTIFILHYLVAATGGYLLLRRWAYPPYLAIVGAILFTFGGTVISLTNVLNHFQTAVWLPWVLLVWERFLIVPSKRKFLAFVAVSLFQFLAGSPELYVLSVVVVLLDTLRVKNADGNIGLGRATLFLLVANLLMVALAMVQVLPTLELLMESRGRNPIPYSEAASWSLSPVSLINLFFLDKQIDAENLTSPRLFFMNKPPFLLSYYLGAVFPFGIALWFYYASRRERGVLLTVVAALLVFALGSRTAVYEFLLRHMPFFGLFRFPEKFFFVIYTLFIFSALKGLFHFCRVGNSARTPVIVVSSVWSFFLLLYIFFRINTEPLSLFVSWATNSPVLTTSTLKRSASALANLEIQVALTSGILLLLLLGRTGKIRKALFEALVVIFVFFDLSFAHRSYQYLLDPDVVYQSARIVPVPDVEHNRLLYSPGAVDLHPSYFSLPKQPPFPKFVSLVFSNLLPNTGVFNGFDYMQEIDALGRWPYSLFLDVARKLSPDKRYRLLGALNVKYVNSFQPLSGEGITLLRHFSEYPSWLYRIDRVVPRAYLVPKVIVEKDPMRTLERLSDSDFDPSREVIIERSVSISPVKDLRREVRIASYTNQAVAVSVSLDNSGILVLTDSFYPGWRVYVDGAEKEILRANLFFRAVALSHGDHLVEFRYEPVSFKIGLAVSLVTLCAVLIVSVRRNIFRR